MSTPASFIWALLGAAQEHGDAAAAPALEPTGPLAVAAATLLEIGLAIGFATLVLGIVLCLWRILRGPHLADRVLAADAMALHVVGLVIVLAIKLDTVIFFDVALVVAIIGFVSSLAFAQYIGSRRKA